MQMEYGANPPSSSGNSLGPKMLDSYHIAETPILIPGTGTGESTVDMEYFGSRRARPSDASMSNHTNTQPSSSRTIEEQLNYSRPSREHGAVRTLPPWIDSFERGDDNFSRPTDSLLIHPSQAHTSQHHHFGATVERRVSHDGWVDDAPKPSPRAGEKSQGLFGVSKEPVRGRKWDHERDRDPVISRFTMSQPASPWKSFIRSSMYGPALNEDGEVKDAEFLNKQTPGYFKPWRGDVNGGDPEKAIGLFHNKKRRRLWYQKLQHVLLMHPLVPLAFRLTVLGTSTTALGISGSIYHRTDPIVQVSQNPSTVMAIVVDTVAIPYICYVTWDEYTGKPLGLRGPKAKMRLVLLDLFFIIFESANLALAFSTLTRGGGSCEKNAPDSDNCGRVRSLCVFLFIGLLAWCFTFTVSIFRLVERVGGRDDTE